MTQVADKRRSSAELTYAEVKSVASEAAQRRPGSADRLVMQRDGRRKPCE